jgi:molybdopterin converting factor small subunit
MKVLFFAQGREAAGRGDFELGTDRAMTQMEFWARLIADFPGLESMRKTARLARGAAYLEEGDLLKPDDEVAVIPPVSGG